jgi:DNA-binding response OmpR family regulator
VQGRPPVIAIFNTSPDTIDMLRIVLEHAGFVVIGAFTYELRDGRVDVESLMRQHQPDAVIYDVAPPYQKNWLEFQHVCAMPALKGAQFVITTTNAKHVREIAGRDVQLFEIVGKPYDLGQIVEQVKKITGHASGQPASPS